MLTSGLLILWAAALAVFDWRQRRLPNLMLLFAWALGLVHAALTGVLPFGAAISDGLGTAIVALLAFWPAYRAGWMGAGDVKLCATIGWLGGVKMLLAVLLIGTLLSGLIGLALLVPGLARHLSGKELAARLRGRIPYGAGLALGFIAWTVVLMRANPAFLK